MEYRILPTGEAWSNGVFCLPKSIMSKIKFMDTTKISVIAVAVASDKIEPTKIAAQLRLEVFEVREALDYWVNEGVLTDGVEIKQVEVEAPAEKKQLESLPMPALSPKDIVAISRENKDIAELLRNSQEILGSTISSAMQSNLVNMVTYYDLTVPVVLTLLHYYKTERDKGKSFTTHRLMQMAEEWANDEVNTLDKASKKLQEIEDINELWSDVIEQCELDYRKPTSANKKMLLRWNADFSMDMISFAINTMKKYNDKEKWSIKEVDNILKDWKRKGCSTPDEVKTYKKPEAKKTDKKSAIASTYNLEKIKKDVELNDDYDI